MRAEYISGDYVPTFGVGHATTLDPSVRTRKKKRPLGFAPPKPKQPRKRANGNR